MNTKYNIFDSHSHYDDDRFNEDRDSVLTQIKNNGVIGIINCSSSYSSINKTDNLTKEWDFIYGAVGIHPENADEFTFERLLEFKGIAQTNSKIVDRKSVV